MDTQIYATFGPSCGTRQILKEMIQSGMTGMRLNLSHTTLPASENYIHAYQEAAKESGVIPQILIDMQGPELRIGAMKKPLLLKEGETVFLIKDELSVLDNFSNASLNEAAIPIPAAVLSAVKTGDQILLDDGKIQLDITKTTDITQISDITNKINAGKIADISDKNNADKTTEANAENDMDKTGHANVENDTTAKNEEYISAQVTRGGVLQGHKSIKILNTNVKMPVLTEHDIENIKLAKAYGVTALMQPFVLSGNDLRYVRKMLKEHHAEDIRIFAKIENRLGIENLKNILPEAGVIVIARGDLGNDMPLWELPAIQKKIERICKQYQKPYIVVTQMLSSMENAPVPTRAEVSDIFHAVIHGAYGVMITGESAIGKYPVEAVKYLKNTALEGELYQKQYNAEK